MSLKSSCFQELRKTRLQALHDRVKQICFPWDLQLYIIDNLSITQVEAWYSGY